FKPWLNKDFHETTHIRKEQCLKLLNQKVILNKAGEMSVTTGRRRLSLFRIKKQEMLNAESKYKKRSLSAPFLLKRRYA
ncbi:hypothetical protein ACI0Y1_003889, partial [Cronobacter sakazakii]